MIQDTRPSILVFVHYIRAVWEQIVEAQQAILRQTTLAALSEQSKGLQYAI